MRRAGGAGPTWHTPPGSGSRSRANVKAVASSICAVASRVDLLRRRRVVGSQLGEEFGGRNAGPIPPAILDQSFPEAVALAIGTAGEVVEIDVEPVAAPEQFRELPRTECDVGFTRRHCGFDVRPQPLGGSRRRGIVDALCQVDDNGQDRVGHDTWHAVERLDGTVDRIGPARDVTAARRVAIGGGRVLALVTRDVEVVDVDQWVPAILLHRSEVGAQPALEALHVLLVVRVLDGRPEADPCQSARHACRREVLQDAVVVVQTRVLAHFGDHELARRHDSGIHGRHGTVPPRGALPPRTMARRSRARARTRRAVRAPGFLATLALRRQARSPRRGERPACV